MNPADFTEESNGHIINTPLDYWVFIPNPLPPQIALSRFPRKPSAFRRLPFFGMNGERNGDPKHCRAVGNRLFQDYAETRASLLCSMCLLTLPDRARSASRNS